MKLQQVGTGRIFGYTEALAKRKDMVVLGAEGKTHTPKQGLSIPSENDESMAMVNNLQAQLDEMMKDNQRLNDRVAELEAENDSLKNVTVESEKDDGRIALVNAAIIEMYTKNDPTDFTGQGKPRVERLETMAGVQDLTSKERDDAYDYFQGLKK